jgi:carboxymethylenebutenolidase
VIVAHELFGVNPDIRGVADDLAAAGYLAIAPEFYHRDAPLGRWLERDDAGREARDDAWARILTLLAS